MAYSREIYDKAYSIIDQRRNYAEKVAQQHMEEIYDAIPQIEDMSRQIRSCSLAAARAVVSGGNTKAELEKLAAISSDLQKQQKELMRQNGYPEDYMDAKYSCPVCRDTSYVEIDGKSVYCDCFINLLKECACDEINKLSPLSLSTFDTFDLEYYPKDAGEGISPFLQMSRIFKYCERYAKDFSQYSRSILMRGATGLGKTHLSLAIANELLQKGFYVVYVSAPSVLSKLENSHFDFNSKEEEQILRTLSDCDLLIIDDLGTEFSSQYTKSTVYNIFNNRLLKNKPSIINTNLTIRELESAYSQRFVSRVIDSCDKLDFVGKDIRASRLKKNN